MMINSGLLLPTISALLRPMPQEDDQFEWIGTPLPTAILQTYRLTYDEAKDVL